MNKYIITTDTTADLYPEFFFENKVDIVPMPYMMGTVEYNIDKFMDYPEFYNAMRAGALPTTGQASVGAAAEIFEKRLKEGYDILHLSFSSGMSGSFENVDKLAAEPLRKNFPNQRIKVVDSLSGAGGEGLLLYYAVKMQKEGKTLDEVSLWLEANKLNVHHFFIVEDLAFLRKGGRISRIEALLGTILGIKPVLELSEEGRIVPVAKARGQKRAIENMCELLQRHYKAESNDFVLIGHGDNFVSAEKLGEAVRRTVGDNVRIEYCYVNYLVGAHAGPGSLALFFVGSSRIR